MVLGLFSFAVHFRITRPNEIETGTIHRMILLQIKILLARYTLEITIAMTLYLWLFCSMGNE
jgi:hypothetical protein